VIATASRPETKEWVTLLGADHVIDHQQSLTEELMGIDFKHIDYIAGLTHTGEYLDEIIEVIALQGKFGLIDDPGTLDVIPFKRKSVSIHWEFMFTRSLFNTDDMIEQHALLSRVSRLVDEGAVRTTLTCNMGAINAKNLIKAHALIESGKSRGKIVLTGF
jgi:zinc-binding alcohol dehydrogenase family protein